MEFVLGIFTGIGLTLFAGYYLNQRERKRQELARKQGLEAVKAMWTSFRITPEDMEFLNSSPPRYPLNKTHAECLNRQLQDAIDRDDYEEAARLRDLINKK